jgi:hypothetical protein
LSWAGGKIHRAFIALQAARMGRAEQKNIEANLVDLDNLIG